MSWYALETDTKYRVELTVWRCSSCGKKAVTTHGNKPEGKCVCAAR